MIQGLTHTDGVLNRVQKYRGKIATGLDAGQEGNATNHMVAVGYFRMCKEQSVNKKGAGGRDVVIKTWVTNREVQDKLEIANTPAGAARNIQPRHIKSLSFYREVSEMWESFLAMYSSEGLMCKGYGVGTKAKRLFFTASGEREWRTVDCTYTECPDFKAGKCTAGCALKVFPSVDVVPTLPYSYSTKGVNSILSIETGLNDIFYMLKAAHKIVELEKQITLPFEGLFMREFMMVHKKGKSGGNDIFSTEVHPTKALVEEIMGPINRFMKNKTALLPKDGGGVLSLLDQSADQLVDKLSMSDDIEDITEGVEIDDTPTQSTLGEEAAKSALQS